MIGFAAHSSQLSYYFNYFLCSGFRAQISASSIFIVMSDPTSNVTSSSCNDLHVSAITSKDSNDIVESSLTSTLPIEPPMHLVLLHMLNNILFLLLFGTLEEAISFYDVYAEACGFEPRKSSQKRSVSGDVKYKFVVCNREGFRDRKRKATVLDSGKEQQLQFREWHNHRLCSLRNQQFQKKHRHLHLYHKKTIIDHSRVNQGPTRAFRNVKEYVDGYENVGAQLVDFKNFGRDIKCFIGDRDAQLFVNYFEDKRDTTEGFYFAYEVDSGKCLFRAFWCDAESRRNYALFGDYITYDPTYSTNKKRRKWIPAYFRDVPMGCLLRTTQRSESQNNFFKRFENAHGTLVEFLMRFQSAIDVQRHTQKQLDRDDDCTLPQLATSLKLEAHASKVYTNVAFSIFKKGIICRHIIWVYSGKQVHTLPDKYILMRWTKNAHKIPLYGPHGELIEDFDATDLRKMEMCKLWSEFYATISVLKNVPTKEITDLVDTLKQFRVKLNPQSESMTKEQELEMLLGCSSSTEVRILPPRQAKNKGSGKRMISKKQQCIAKAEKPKRLCRNCKQMAHHDKRIVLMLLYLMPTIRVVQMRMMLMMVDRSKEFLLMALINYSSNK
ncbi:protein FAR1-RELATED SEQUENCE 5-like [Silene latifolia]|uniref:protein FAR1-RELATED SEQUENCE 5-like n=1 Tax=Silene latifolia TaxID=37657 RepID=UPI003D77F0E4